MRKPTFLEVKAVVDTLPIGFYAERRITASLDENADCSMYNPKDDNIVIAYKQICQGFKELTDESKKASLIRSNFYHEVSHAILTPRDMKVNNARNIFEDERIEQTFKGLFYGVNFEEAKYLINGIPVGGEIPPPTDSMSAFYHLVRFHKGSKYWRGKVETLMKEYDNLTRNTVGWSVHEYEDDIDDLYREFADACEREGIEKVMDSKPMGGEGEGKEGEGMGEGEGKPMACGEEGDVSSDGAMADPVALARAKEIFASVIDTYMNQDLHKALEILFANFRKKNSKGSSTAGHSGVLNVRRADTPDYRIFDRASTARGSNPFGSIHLNLFIDVSGSFHSNDDAVNALLHSLALLERKYHHFTYDVVTVGPREVILPKENRYIESSGGNHISKKIYDIYRKLQLPQTYNYNIIMFDGDAYSNDVSRSEFGADWISTKGEGFKAFAHNNCTIISDPYNQKYIDEFCPSTRTIYTRDFVKTFTKNILDILQIALS